MSKSHWFRLQRWSRGQTFPLPLYSAAYKKKNASTTRDGNSCPGGSVPIRNWNARLPVRSAACTTISKLSTNGSQRVCRSQRVPAAVSLGSPKATPSSDTLRTRTEQFEQPPRAQAWLSKTCAGSNAGCPIAAMAAPASSVSCHTLLACPRTPAESVASRRSAPRLHASNRTACFTGPSMRPSPLGAAAIFIGNREE